MERPVTPAPHPLVRIHDGPRDLLVVRLSADGLAGEVVIDTPSIRLAIRVPEIVAAVRNVVPPAPASAPPGWTGANGGQPWTCVETVL